MVNLELMQRQIDTLLAEVKKLKEEDGRKSNAINGLMHELNGVKNEFGSMRKKMKSDLQSLESKIKK